MHVLFTVGRIALVVTFIFSGAGKLLDIPGTADLIQAKITIPAELNDVTSQIESMVGLSIWQLFAILVAALEVIAGLLIAFGVLTRTAAAALLLYTGVATFYFHDFWNMTGVDRTNNMSHALKNLSIIGAFLMLAAWPRRSAAVAGETERIEPL